MLPPNFDNLSNEQFALMIEAAMIGYVFSVDKLAIAVEKEKPLIHEVLASLSDFVIYLDDTYKDYCFIDEHTFLTFKSFDTPTQTSNLLQKVTYYYQNKNKYLENKFASLLSQIEHHTHNLTEIIKNPYIQEGNLPKSLIIITETLSRVIDISRVSVWKYRKDGDYIECLDLYEKLYNKHSKGVMLYKKDFPAYFSALETETTINADNAHTNPYTHEFSEIYLTPLQIFSMLDVPFYVEGELAGVICFEHQFYFRKWKPEEIMFTTSICSVLSITYQSLLIKNREQEIKKQNQALQSQQAEITAQNEELNQQQEELTAINEALLLKNQLIETQSVELKKQYEILETQQKQLKETTLRLNKSIAYAKSIQNVVLPESQEVLASFADYFVIYLPKDVVSGDFYWFYQIDNQRTIFILADCTGHGVSGAFMSMIGNSLLYKIIKVKEIYDPATILYLLHDDIYDLLKQKYDKNRDGMDISICYFEKDNLSKKISITFAGAKSSIFYSQNGFINQLNGDRISIGGFTERKREFHNQKIGLSEGDLVYFASDGYIDQNDVNRKRFGSTKFKNLLHQIHTQKTDYQKYMLLSSLKEHQQNEEQRDDISVIGIKL